MMSRLRNYSIIEFDSTTLTGSYQNFGSALSDEVIGFTIYNASDVDVYISKDGSTNNIRIPAGGTFSFCSSYYDGNKFAFSKSAQLRIKQVTGAGSSGYIIANFVLEG